MALILSKFRRLAAAIGIGLLVETLLFAGTVLLTDNLPRPWDERVFALGARACVPSGRLALGDATPRL